jgi:monothiol glutaredoxin
MRRATFSSPVALSGSLSFGAIGLGALVAARLSMTRSILDESHIHPAIRETIANHHADIVREVQAAIAANDVVVVGMKQNPFPKKARKALDAAGVTYRYLEYGSYFGDWRRRNALKMWTGWPTFPMVFVKGVLIGGAAELARFVRSGELNKTLGR